VYLKTAYRKRKVYVKSEYQKRYLLSNIVLENNLVFKYCYLKNILIKLLDLSWGTFGSIALADMRYFADAADAVCVTNMMFCVTFVLEFTRLTLKVTILRENKYLILNFW
jgi:hypothetical protein